MMVAIRKSLRDFLAVSVLVIVAAVTGYVIVQEQRLRIPILEEKPFELKAEFQTAQAVVPGQGQTIRVAGVRVGDVQEVELVGGRAVVTFAVDREFLPIYEDATILMRPNTGLKDMFFSLDPGTASEGEYDEGGIIPMSNTLPDVNLDEVLAGLDGDSRAYLRTLVVGAGQGLKGRGKDLGRLLGSLGPINRDLDQLSSEVAKRRTNLSNLVHNLNILTREVGTQDDNLARLITTANTTLAAIGEQDPDVQRAVGLLPGALRDTREALQVLDEFGNELGPAFNELRPFARNLPELNASTLQLAERVTPVIRDQIRPFVRSARPPIPDLNRAARVYSKATPKLTVVGKKINKLGNMAAYNPRGAEPADGDPERAEGYLYWAAWAAHNGTSTFGSQDGNGPFRRIYFTASCESISNLLAGSALGPVITGLTTGLGALGDLGQPCESVF